jgi:hypothetical protein
MHGDFAEFTTWIRDTWLPRQTEQRCGAEIAEREGSSAPGNITELAIESGYVYDLVPGRIDGDFKGLGKVDRCVIGLIHP